MANVRILARNRARDATISASPTLLAARPASNLILPTMRGRTGRSTSLASQTISLAWDEDQTGNVVAVTRHNRSVSATQRSILYQAGSPSILHDTGALAAFSTTGLDTELDDHTSWDFGGLKNTTQYVPLQTLVRSLDIVTADASNPDGYIDQTQVWFGKYFEFTYNPAHGEVPLTLMDASTQARADDGSQVVDVKWRARKLVINLDLVSDDDLPSVLAIAQRLGKNGECLIDVYPETSGAKHLYNLMACRLVDSPTFNPSQYGWHKNTMTFEET